MLARVCDRARWIRGPLADSGLALAWVPFSLAALAVGHDPSSVNRLLTATFVVSFLHQPLTLALVYGDPGQFAARRRLFIWSPVAFLAAIAVGMQVSVVAVALVAGAWNAIHTLLQRFGIVRVYGRKVGEGAQGAALERAMLFSWLGLALVWVAADPRTPATVSGLALGEVNATALTSLGALRPIALPLVPLAAVVAGALVWRWMTEERGRGPSANPAKHAYVASTAALFITILVAPVAGFIGYVGSHAIEYFVVVGESLGRRYEIGGGGALGGVVRRVGAGWVLATAVVVTFVLYVGLRLFPTESPLTWVILAAGGLHVFYDGFIWKLRRPEVAAGLRLAPAAR